MNKCEICNSKIPRGETIKLYTPNDFFVVCSVQCQTEMQNKLNSSVEIVYPS